MTTNDPTGGRRAWRTEEEWLRLRERIAADLSTNTAPDTTSKGDMRPRRLLPYGTRQAVIAAGLLAAAVLATMLARWPLGTGLSETRIASTGIGERLLVRLSDGSSVTLGPTSTLHLSLGESRREIRLAGVASFDIRHDARRPLVVLAGNARATDIGTSFVVRAYPAEQTVLVAVSSGVVSLSGAETRTSAIELRGGGVGVVAADGVPKLRPDLDVAASSAWERGGLAFKDEPLSLVASELGRWFDARVTVPDSSLARRHVTAMYNDPSLAGVLDALAAALDLEWVRSPDGRAITITSRRP